MTQDHILRHHMPRDGDGHDRWSSKGSYGGDYINGLHHLHFHHLHQMRSSIHADSYCTCPCQNLGRDHDRHVSVHT